MNKILIGIGSAAVIYNIVTWQKQLRDRKMLYKEAKKYANSINKPLLVVGRPKGRHGCGDVNVDIVGGECPSSIQADIQDMSMFSNKEFGAVFVGHVLEHVDDIEKAYNELDRVADKMFISYPDWYSMIAYLHPEHKWLILNAPPRGRLRYVRIRGKRI